VEQKRRIAALEAQMAKHSIQELTDEEKAAKVDKKPKPFACWKWGEPSHLLMTCRKKNIIVRVVRGNKEGIDLLIGESFLKRQQNNSGVGVIVRRRLVTDEVPTRIELDTESETTKSWLAAAQGNIDEASKVVETNASAERTIRSTSDGEDNSEEHDEVDRMSKLKEDEPEQDYDTFVESVQKRKTTAFAEVRNGLKQNTERNKRYYNIGLKPKHFEVSQ